MKINPAIVILLGVVVFVAVTFVAIAWEPGQYFFTAAWIIAVLAASIFATGRTTASSVFARGTILGLAFGVFVFHGPAVGLFFAAQRILDRSFFFGSGNLRVVTLAIAIAFGVLWGCLALWRYSRQESKAQKS